MIITGRFNVYSALLLPDYTRFEFQRSSLAADPVGIMDQNGRLLPARD
jgi:hypothetical protein